MIALLVLLCVFSNTLRYADATVPSCAVLFCGEGDACAESYAGIWIGAAQDEAVRIYHTINGGVLAPLCVGSAHEKRIGGYHVPYDHLLCIDERELPREECARKGCNYESHPELFEDDECVSGSYHRPDDNDQAACRTLGSWLKIATQKLADALAAEAKGDFEAAASAACVAELLFARIAEYLLAAHPGDEAALAFINAAARAKQHYAFVNGATLDVLFADADSLESTLRVVQSTRDCRPQPLADDAPPAKVTSLLVYAAVNSSEPVEEQTQLVWAVAGTLAPFDATVAADNLCATEGADSNLPLYEVARRYPQLDTSDWAVVLGDGAPRPYLDLRASASRPLVSLLDSIGAEPVGSLTQLNLRRGVAPQEADELDAYLAAAVYARVATGDVCADAVGLVIDTPPPPPNGNETEITADFRAPRAGVPLTLAPDESRCVGGERAGQVCEHESECAVGWACRRKPFAPRRAAFCYNGESWDTRQPCAFADADEECPYGECFGDANGNSGGAYPFLHFFQSNECHSTSAAADPVCSDEHVVRWTQYANEKAFA
jgi:hypothetical protein